MSSEPESDKERESSDGGDGTGAAPDFFEQVVDEVAAARRAGRQFAPGAITKTLAQPERRTG